MLRRGQHPFQESIRFVGSAQDRGLSLPHLAPSLAGPFATRKRSCELHLVRLGLQEPAAGRVRPSSAREPSPADEQRHASTSSSCSPPSTVTVVAGRDPRPATSGDIPAHWPRRATSIRKVRRGQHAPSRACCPGREQRGTLCASHPSFRLPGRSPWQRPPGASRCHRQ